VQRDGVQPLDPMTAQFYSLFSSRGTILSVGPKTTSPCVERYYCNSKRLECLSFYSRYIILINVELIYTVILLSVGRRDKNKIIIIIFSIPAL